MGDQDMTVGSLLIYRRNRIPPVVNNAESTEGNTNNEDDKNESNSSAETIEEVTSSAMETQSRVDENENNNNSTNINSPIPVPFIDEKKNNDDNNCTTILTNINPPVSAQFVNDDVQYYDTAEDTAEDATDKFDAPVQAVVIEHEIKSTVTTYTQLRSVQSCDFSLDEGSDMSWAQVMNESTLPNDFSFSDPIPKLEGFDVLMYDDEVEVETSLYNLHDEHHNYYSANYDEMLVKEEVQRRKRKPSHTETLDDIFYEISVDDYDDDDDDDDVIQINAVEEVAEVVKKRKKTAIRDVLISGRKKRRNVVSGDVGEHGRLCCAQCGKNFKNRNTLYNHRSIYHRVGGKGYRLENNIAISEA